MIDGFFKTKIDRFWDQLARGLVVLRLSPNQVTAIGLFGLLALCAYYAYAPFSPAIFGLSIAAFFAFDSLDGAVARLTNSSSKFGGYLDAIADRYQEVAVFAALAYVHDCWPAVFLATSGSLMVSYAKARTAIEIEIDNDKWPDLMERLERVVVLCLSLVLTSFISWPESWPVSFIAVVLYGMGLLAHITAIQRFFRARRLLLKSGDKES
tara:strand:+ start:797 stop:1426 length:630 start_codon:yes stop_codon:yes gene_type:complete